MPEQPKPTIDERLDRLTERHEALTQTVELLTADVHRISGDIDKLLIIVTIQNERNKRLEDKSAA